LRKRKGLTDNFSRFFDERYFIPIFCQTFGYVTVFYNINGPMSFNKLAISAVNGALEIQPALANINFDFSLWKVAPPKEFEGVGAALTTFRRDEAEKWLHTSNCSEVGSSVRKVAPEYSKPYQGVWPAGLRDLRGFLYCCGGSGGLWGLRQPSWSGRN
jgi:hypothetical protein